MSPKNRFCPGAGEKSREDTGGERIIIFASPALASAVRATPWEIQISWYLFLFMIILGGIAVSLLLLMLSKNPKDWRHTSMIHEEKQKGNLRTLAESIKMLPPSYEGYSPVRGLMKRLFFEKITVLRGISDEELKKLYKNDPVTLNKYIKDPDLIQWLKNPHSTKEQQGTFDFLQKERVEKKNQYQTELMKILEKMEKWGT